MNSVSSLTSLFFTVTLLGINAQWYIIKKDYPSDLMNYPNPGKRSIAEDKSSRLNIDCSISYSHMNAYEEKIAWILLCSHRKSPLIAVMDSSASSYDNIDDEFYPTAQIISRERRSSYTMPPYFNEYPDLFNKQLWKHLR